MSFLTARNHFVEKVFILSPPFLCSLFVLIIHALNMAPKETSPFTWLIVVVLIDVAHVWSTLFRTYLSREGLKKWKNPLWFVPLCCYLSGVTLYAFGPRVFWFSLAYLAVFHFIRQQYGLYQIYSRREEKLYKDDTFGKVTIYSATIIPLLIWHFSGPQNFFWFVPEDFIYLPLPKMVTLFKFLGPVILISYLVQEWRKNRGLQLRPKVLIILGTYLSWWTGIVWIGTDWSFTVTNVISHGVPYFALIGIIHFNKKQTTDLLWPRKFALPTALAFLFTLGFLEEGFWDVLLWRDHPQFFNWLFDGLYQRSPVTEMTLQSFIVPLLALPQATHYALDGLIWKRS